MLYYNTLMNMCFNHPQEVAGARKQIAYKSSQGFEVDAGTPLTDRLTMGEDLSLTISSVMVDDERSFFCQVTAGVVGVSEAETQVKVFCKSDCKRMHIIFLPSLLAWLERLCPLL